MSKCSSKSSHSSSLGRASASSAGSKKSTTKSRRSIVPSSNASKSSKCKTLREKLASLPLVKLRDVLLGSKLTLVSHLASSFSSTVFKVVDDRNQFWAAKVINRSAIYNQMHLKSELAIVQEVRHKHVLRAQSVIGILSKWPIIVFDYAPGGDLHAFLRSTGAPKNDLKQYFVQTARGLCYLHAIDIAHRDVKAENVLLFSSGSKSTPEFLARLADFGFSMFLRGRPALLGPGEDLCGTAEYLAAEILMQDSYDPRPADIFAMGVLLHLLITSRFPFGHGEAIRSEAGIVEQLRNMARKSWLADEMLAKDEALKKLLGLLLAFKPETRPTAEKLLSDAWMAK